MHGGASPQAKRKAAERIALEAEYQAHPRRTPSEQLAEVGDRQHFLMTKAWQEVDTGTPTVATVRELTEQLERVARLSKLNLDAGTSERQTRVMEAQAAALGMVLDRIFDRLELSPSQRTLVTVVVPEELQRQHELEAGEGRG